MKKELNQIYKSDFAEYLLCLALDVGEGMLESGGEIARVEDTVKRICCAYGASHVEVFTITSAINAAIRMPDGSYSSQIRRIYGSSEPDLFRLELFNKISRDICKATPSLEAFDGKISRAKRIRAYPEWVKVLASGMASGAFAVFFGGGVIECIFAVLIGFIISMLEMYSTKSVTGMAKTFISAFFAGILSFFASALVPSADRGIIMIGTIMLLVPGVSFGIALRDLLCGDLLSGIIECVQSVLVALMIAFGYMLSMVLTGGVWF